MTPLVVFVGFVLVHADEWIPGLVGAASLRENSLFWRACALSLTLGVTVLS
jgi:hypothetical protein